MADERNRRAGLAAAEASLAQELQSILEKLAGAESDAEADEGLEKIRQLREAFLSGGEGDRAANRHAEELIRTAEEKLTKLKNYLAQKRRVQEGMLMRKVAARREAEEAAFCEALRHAEAPAAPEAGEAPEEKKEEPETKPVSNEVRDDASAVPKAEKGKQAPSPAPAAAPAKEKGYEWNRAYLITAHLAASFSEDGKFFEKLRRDAVKGGRRAAAPRDDREAEAHFKTVHALNVRLVNIEMKTRAIAAAYKNGGEVSGLFRSASTEIKAFMTELKARKAERPGLAAEYDRLFGGYAEVFASMPADKGGELLEKCAAEQKHRSVPEPRSAEEQRVMIRNEE